MDIDKTMATMGSRPRGASFGSSAAIEIKVIPPEIPNNAGFLHETSPSQLVPDAHQMPKCATPLATKTVPAMQSGEVSQRQSAAGLLDGRVFRFDFVCTEFALSDNVEVQRQPAPKRSVLRIVPADH